MFSKGMYLSFLTELKTFCKDFNMSFNDMLELPPFEFNVLKLMIMNDLKKQNEELSK